MVGHVAAPSLTGDNTPCSLSQAVVTDILRNEMNYDGVIITDALNMSAISQYYSADEAAVLALRAGCDMLLMPEDLKPPIMVCCRRCRRAPFPRSVSMIP